MRLNAIGLEPVVITCCPAGFVIRDGLTTFVAPEVSTVCGTEAAVLAVRLATDTCATFFAWPLAIALGTAPFPPPGVATIVPRGVGI